MLVFWGFQFFNQLMYACKCLSFVTYSRCFFCLFQEILFFTLRNTKSGWQTIYCVSISQSLLNVLTNPLYYIRQWAYRLCLSDCGVRWLYFHVRVRVGSCSLHSAGSVRVVPLYNVAGCPFASVFSRQRAWWAISMRFESITKCWETGYD